MCVSIKLSLLDLVCQIGIEKGIGARQLQPLRQSPCLSIPTILRQIRDLVNSE